ncbi:MAG: rhomboid family intramembrane serine protease [Cellvibrionales bacterium]|nr:rhomboid family intramembrane serine protease [Cellvibrionales bacterium]
MSAIKKRIRLIALLCGAMIAVFVVDLYLQGALKAFGIFPRSQERLPFILSAPFIHGNWQHLLNNLPGFAVLSFLCMAKSTRFYLWASAFIIIVSGLLVWCFARQAVHIGASGWIFGLWALCLAQAYFSRSLMNIVIALLVLIFYGGMVFGMFPQGKGVSFEAHIFGAVAGFLCAFLFSKKIR